MYTHIWALNGITYRTKIKYSCKLQAFFLSVYRFRKLNAFSFEIFECSHQRSGKKKKTVSLKHELCGVLNSWWSTREEKYPDNGNAFLKCARLT